MKNAELKKRIAKLAKANGAEWLLTRQGGSHEIYSFNGTMIVIPRHAEINERLAKAIIEQCKQLL